MSIELASLPGVRRHVRTVGAALRAGRSCAWFLPAALSAEPRVDEVLDLLAGTVPLRTVEPCPPPPLPPAPPEDAEPEGAPVPVVGSIDSMMRSFFAGTATHPVSPGLTSRSAAKPLAERVLQAAYAFGCTPASDVAPARDPVVLLAGLTVRGGVTLAVRADAEPDRAELTALMRRYPVVARDCPGAEARDRPTLLTMGTPAVLSELARPDPLIADAFWWWGIHTRLDMLTAATTAEQLDPTAVRRRRWDEFCPDLAPEVIAEVAAPDVDLAAHLAVAWDGTWEHLVEEMAGPHSPRHTSEPAEGVGGPAGSRPPLRLWEPWSSGRVGVWDGLVRGAPRCASTELAERVWIGQARALQPLLDRWRRSLVAEVLTGSPPAALNQLDQDYCPGHSVASIELNNLRKATRDRVVTLPPRCQRILDEVVGARNELAHRRVVDENRLDRLHRLTTDQLRSGA